MKTGYVLYNLGVGKDQNVESIKQLKIDAGKELKYVDICSIKDYGAFFSGLDKEDGIILVGGDGTLNRFVNDTEGLEVEQEVLYFPNGTGNDFAHDLGHAGENRAFPVTDYIKNLPYVLVKNKKYRIVNGIGYGIDGYCCEVGDAQKKVPGKTVNYTTIAIKGLLFHYKPTDAKVTVDGKTTTYKKVWLAPTMNGRFYGGGMMPTPNQKRNSGVLSVMVFHGSGKLRTLMIFPSLFKGEHVKHTKCVDVLEGKEITVEFDRPTTLQIDGETILGVTSYTAVASAPALREKESIAQDKATCV